MHDIGTLHIGDICWATGSRSAGFSGVQEKGSCSLGSSATWNGAVGGSEHVISGIIELSHQKTIHEVRETSTLKKELP